KVICRISPCTLTCVIRSFKALLEFGKIEFCSTFCTASSFTSLEGEKTGLSEESQAIGYSKNVDRHLNRLVYRCFRRRLSTVLEKMKQISSISNYFTWFCEMFYEILVNRNSEK